MDVSAIIVGLITGFTAAALMVWREFSGRQNVEKIKNAVVNPNGGQTLVGMAEEIKDMADEIRNRLGAFEKRLQRLETEAFEKRRGFS